jgi:hypothetical protein
MPLTFVCNPIKSLFHFWTVLFHYVEIEEHAFLRHHLPAVFVALLI